jgi:hypothetical protein
MRNPKAALGPRKLTLPYRSQSHRSRQLREAAANQVNNETKGEGVTHQGQLIALEEERTQLIRQ